METIESKQINDWLKGGPKVPLTEQQLFRLVWSDEQREKRWGTFVHFDMHGNKIGETQKLEECLKYSCIKERWILEQWFPPEVTINPELPESHLGSYEPVYVFEDNSGRSLPLRLDAVQFVVKCAMKPKRSELQRKIDDKNAHEEKDNKIFKADLDLLQDEGPLVSQFHDGSAILRP